MLWFVVLASTFTLECFDIQGSWLLIQYLQGVQILTLENKPTSSPFHHRTWRLEEQVETLWHALHYNQKTFFFGQAASHLTIKHFIKPRRSQSRQSQQSSEILFLHNKPKSSTLLHYVIHTIHTIITVNLLLMGWCALLPNIFTWKLFVYRSRRLGLHAGKLDEVFSISPFK